MKTGNARAPALSPDIVDRSRMPGCWASVEHGASRVRSGHLLWALLADDMLARRAREASGQFAAIEPDVLKRDYLAICGNTPEATQATGQAVGSEAACCPQSRFWSKTQYAFLSRVEINAADWIRRD